MDNTNTRASTNMPARRFKNKSPLVKMMFSVNVSPRSPAESTDFTNSLFPKLEPMNYCDSEDEFFSLDSVILPEDCLAVGTPKIFENESIPYLSSTPVLKSISSKSKNATKFIDVKLPEFEPNFNYDKDLTAENDFSSSMSKINHTLEALEAIITENDELEEDDGINNLSGDKHNKIEGLSELFLNASTPKKYCSTLENNHTLASSRSSKKSDFLEKYKNIDLEAEDSDMDISFPKFPEYFADSTNTNKRKYVVEDEDTLTQLDKLLKNSEESELFIPHVKKRQNLGLSKNNYYSYLPKNSTFTKCNIDGHISNLNADYPPNSNIPKTTNRLKNEDSALKCNITGVKSVLKHVSPNTKNKYNA